MGSPFSDVMMSPGRMSASAAGEPAETPATQMPETPSASSNTAHPLMPIDSTSPVFICSTTGEARSWAMAKNCAVVVATAPPA